MKKRTIALLMAAVMLLGVTVGGTIAWMTAEATEVVNTFTVGDINIKLDEADVNREVVDDTGETTIVYDEYVNGENEHVGDIDDANRVQTNEYKLIPGSIYSKDPKVTVLANSEDCYVYIRVNEENNEQPIIQWTLGENWIPLGDNKDIYVYATKVGDKMVPTIVSQTNSDRTLASIITYVDGDTIINDKIKINSTLTQDVIQTMDGKVDSNLTGDEKEKAIADEIAKRPMLTFDAYAVQAANMGTENTMEAAVEAWEAAAFDLSGTTTTN